MKRNVKITIDVPGIIGAIDDGARDGLALGSNLVVNEAKTTAPHHTGLLANSIMALPPYGNLSEGQVSTMVSAGAPYAGYVEFGTGIYGPKGQRIFVEPTRRKALRFPAPGGNGFFFSKGHYIDGAKAQPFLIPAVDNNADAVAEIVADAVELAIDKARV